MQTSAWSSPLTRKLSVFIELDGRDRAVLAELESATRHVRQGAELLSRGGRIDNVQVVRDGWAVRSKTLPDGRRQIIDFVLPGNLVGFYGHIVPLSEEAVTALTPMIVASFSTERMPEIFAQYPRLASGMAWLAAREDQILAERLVSMGRRSAYERLAHIFLELWERLRIRGLAGNGRLPIPLTQSTLADALGLSVVHVNRTLSQLAKAGLIEMRRRERVLEIVDHAGLCRAAGFEGTYLLHQQISGRLTHSLDAVARQDRRVSSSALNDETVGLPEAGVGHFKPK